MINKKDNIKFFYIAVLILAIILITGITFSYYSTTYVESSQFKTANIEINLNNSQGELNDVVFSSAYLVDSVLPGDELNFKNLLITNNGNIDVYCLINLKIKIRPVGENLTIIDYWYNSEGQLVDTDFTKNCVGATKIVKEGSETFKICYRFDGDDYNNLYKKAEIDIQIGAYAIQDNLEQNEQFPTQDLYASYLIIENNN